MKGALLALVLVLAAFAAEYRSVWRAGFVYEDQRAIGGVLSGDTIRWGVPRALTRASWIGQREQSAAAHHALNLALQLTAAGLVALCFWRLTADRFLAIAGATVLALHPIAIEAVAYITGRADLIATIGILLAVAAATWPRSVRSSAAIAAGLLIGVWGKETAIVAVPLVALTWWLQGRAPASLVAAVTVALLLVAWLASGRTHTATFHGGFSGAWAMTQAAAAARLGALSVWPVGLTVDYDYDRWTWLSRALAAGAAGVTLLAIGAINRRMAFGCAWIAIAVAPRLVVQTPDSVFNEHQWHDASLGVAWLLAHALRQLPATVTCAEAC